MHLRVAIVFLFPLVALACAPVRPATPPLAETDPDLTDIITRAIAWERYWSLGEHDDVIRNEARTRGPMTTWTSGPDDAGSISVFIDQLMWRVDLSRNADGRWQADHVDRILWSDSYESSKRRCANKTESPLIPRLLRLSPISIEAVLRPASSTDDSRQIEAMVQSIVTSKDVRAFIRRAQRKRDGVRKFWIGWATPGIPRIYYCIEGIDYLGIIEYDGVDWRVIHHDLLLADYNVRGTGALPSFEYRRIVDRLRAMTSPIDLGTGAAHRTLDSL